jgi:hypothetical protein
MQRYFIPLGIIVAFASAALLPSAAGAVYYHQAPPRYVAPAPQFVPRFQTPRIMSVTPRINPGGGYMIAPHLVRHPGPMVYGRNGWHPSRNRTAIAVIPGLLAGEIPLDTETFLASIDVTSPLEPIDGCSSAPCPWGAMSMANDGSWGSAWKYDNPDAARSAATGNCTARASEPCAGIFTAVGAAWIAGLHCQRYDAAGTYWHWSVMTLGNDLGAAVRNAYRTVALNGFYNVDECDFVASVAANGAQTQFVARE